jgi:ribulose-5-phosphate 4-epimerase/fuculose-1-phosphate aldolase
VEQRRNRATPQSNCTPSVEGVAKEIADCARLISSLRCAPGRTASISVALQIKGLDQELSLARSGWSESAVMLPQWLRTSMDSVGETTIVATLSGSRMRHVASDPAAHVCVLRIGETERVARMTCYHPSGSRHTSELLSHLAVHSNLARRGLAESAVIHAHTQALVDYHAHHGSRWIVAEGRLRTRRYELDRALGRSPIGVVPFLPPGSIALAEQTLAVSRDCNVVVWESHGVIIGDRTLDACCDLVEYLECASVSAFRDAFARRTVDGQVQTDNQ